MSRLRFLLLALIGLLPSGLKIPLYRGLFGWQIGRNVRIGPSLIDARHVSIGDNVVIGRLNRFQRIPELILADKVHIGNRNVFVTGPEVAVADVKDAAPRLYIGEDSYIIGPHFFDVHAPLRIERSVTLAGRNSSFYTHGLDYRINRLIAKPITVGENGYVGAHALFAPGAAIAPNSIVGMGALVTRPFAEEFVLIGGNPACIVKELDRSAQHFTRPRPGYPEGRTVEALGESQDAHRH